MKPKKIIAAVTAAAVMLSGCGLQSSRYNEDLTQEEQERKAVREWLSLGLNDIDEFPDKKDYQYYARTLGLEMNAFLSADMWEVYYSEEININRDIDEKAVFLIRLKPRKLLEIYAENNECTVDDICNELSLTADQLYYNWGYTASAVDYSKNHKDNKSAYSEKEERIFGADNGENRQTVMSTHFLTVDIADGNSVSYSTDVQGLEMRQRDLLHITTKNSYDYSVYTEEERNAAFTVNGIGIRRVLPLSVPNGWAAAEDKDITVMLNASPFSYGCTDDDLIISITETEAESETAAEETDSDTDVNVSEDESSTSDETEILAGEENE